MPDPPWDALHACPKCRVVFVALLISRTKRFCTVILANVNIESCGPDELFIVITVHSVHKKCSLAAVLRISNALIYCIKGRDMLLRRSYS
jgi:hypothetical protein